MLGFRQGISASDSLAVYLDFINYGMELRIVDPDFTFNSNISALKYELGVSGQKIGVGVEEQNERYVIVVLLFVFRTLLPTFWWSP